MLPDSNSRQELEKQLVDTFEQHYRLFVILASQNLYKRIQREAEDVVQDAFLAAFEQLHRTFRGDSSMKTWISIIIQRTAWRRNRNQDPVLGMYQDITEMNLEHLNHFCQQIEDSEILDKLISELTTEQQEFLRYWRADAFRGRMEENKNRNNLSRTKTRMKMIAENIGVLRQAA
jgi:RNA polymerase sigma factor (sigma-70 family)